MRKIIEWTEAERDFWISWVNSRPPVIQDLCYQLPPDNLYRRKSSGDKVTIYSYEEDGTVTVSVQRKYNPGCCLFDRRVFGVSPEDLKVVE
jgi:hypothetical protein